MSDLGGRPTKFNDLTTQRIVASIRAGTTLKAAAESARIASQTLYLWIHRGRRGEQPYADFVARLDEAGALAEREMVDVVFEAAREGKWQAALAWLERARGWRVAPSSQPTSVDDETSGIDDEDAVRSVLAAIESRRSG